MILFALIALGGCTGSNQSADEKPGANKPPDDKTRPSADNKGSNSSRNDVSKGKADFSVTARELANEYKRDAAAAEKKYIGKVVELAGVVSDVGLDSADNPVLMFEGDKNDFFMCTTVAKEPWSRVAPGQKIKIRGKGAVAPGQKIKIRGKGAESVGRPSLDACVFVEAGPHEAVTVTATQLARDYEANEAETNAKYGPKDVGKYLVITGEVVEKKAIDKVNALVFLKGTDKSRVECGFHFALPDGQAAFLDSIKIGQQLKAFGRYNPYSGKEAKLTNCFKITLP
jgi:hypothetical protein